MPADKYIAADIIGTLIISLSIIYLCVPLLFTMIIYIYIYIIYIYLYIYIYNHYVRGVWDYQIFYHQL